MVQKNQPLEIVIGIESIAFLDLTNFFEDSAGEII